MDCRQAKMLALDMNELLSGDERAQFESHLHLCDACRTEQAEWLRISQALRSLNEPIAPPAGFVQAVMERIHPPKSSLWLRMGAKGRQMVAGAAAAAALVLASAGVSPLLHSQPVKIADNTGPVQPSPVSPNAENGGIALPAPPGGSGAALPEPQASADGEKVESTDRAGVEALAPSNRAVPLSPSEKASPPSPRSGDPADNRLQMAAQPDSVEFLSKKRELMSTLVKVSVADLAAAKGKIADFAGEYGIQPESITAQNTDNQRIEILRYVLRRQEANPFINRFASLGELTQKKTETQDITARFETAIEQRKMLIAQQEAARDAGQKQQLALQIVSLDRQLRDWDSESNGHVVIVMVEEKGTP
ncbi:hypothetical protein GTO91_07400 [Heliobacterium undosum]|uniref:Zinc-finger domain-containing protein n=1 Tax=Heliomicrobium undosum TaxID=121734 RepID=A0A845L9D4_9FIRM|nr:hypothetical protein [Heliomicrobium undosum]MZP29531.1 hypothetical protein [Heliomicrobium undosum]